MVTQRADREGGHVAQMQRRRLLTATVELVFEGGTQSLRVASLCERSALSRRTFYDFFADREDCLHATFKDAVAQARKAILDALAAEAPVSEARSWRERVRIGLVALLSFLDYEPGVGRLLIVDALAAGERTLHARRELLTQIVALVDAGRAEAKGRRVPPPLTAEGIVGAVFSVVHTRMLDHDQRPLVELTGPLMAMIVQPYLGPAAARRELERPVSVEPPSTPRLPADPFKDLPMRLTYRTALVLSTIAQAPGASNKQVGRTAGIADEGQTSKLLARLQRHQLIQDTATGLGRGRARAWTLTQRGEAILQAVGRGQSAAVGPLRRVAPVE